MPIDGVINNLETIKNTIILIDTVRISNGYFRRQRRCRRRRRSLLTLLRLRRRIHMINDIEFDDEIGEQLRLGVLDLSAIRPDVKGAFDLV